MGEWAKNEVRDSGLWSEEHDRLPLKQRLKIVLARGGFSDLFPDINLENDATSNLPVVADDGFVKEENGQCSSENFVLQSFPSASFARDEKVGSWSYEHNYTGKLGDCNDQLIEANTVSVELVQAEKLSVMDHSSPKRPPLSPHDVSVSVQCDVHSSSSSFRNHSNGGYLQEIKIKDDNPVDFFEELDHVLLKERRRMLVSSQALGLTKTSLEGITVELSRPSVDDLDKQSTGIVKKEASFVDKDLPFAENSNCEMQKISNVISSKGGIGSLANADHRGSYLGCDWQDNRSINSEKVTTIQEKDKACSLEKKLSKSGAICAQNLLSSKTILRNSILPNFVNVKVEPLDNYETDLKNFRFSRLPVDDMDPLKSEPGLLDDLDQDNLDHMLLRERMKLLSAEVPHSDVFGMKCLSKMVPTGLDCQPIAQESSKPLRINRPRKRRKTATDSVETALEEDAPGLLQVLIQKGVSVNEIKLYGEAESDEALDDSSTENFSELEAIISKLFCRRNSLLKLAPLRCAKGEKATYCLACLFSLVEQARYIQFRKWPVEWGWCRDLQAFIFVFERHNRIVLERPEYGYATYFFELMDSLPIDWQIKRLVTAMKLTSCSRVTLIENKALVVGEDLTEGEARVLMEYGWIPNTGLGSMLNYCDRVVHDRKNEDTSDWRSKIGKLLIDGYNGGCIVPNDVPKKVGKCNFAQIPEIKMETN